MRTKRGELKTVALDYPRGHYRNPMDDREVETKFRTLAGRMLAAGQVSTALDRLWNIDNEPQASVLLDVLARSR